MAESLINSIARLRVIEKRLISKDQAARLVSAPSYEDALRLLREAGYGRDISQQEGEGDEIERIISAELAASYQEVEELMPERHKDITGVFRMRHDVTNIKLLYKLRLMGQELKSAKLDEGGVYGEEELKSAMASGDYSMMPKQLEKTLEKLDVDTYYGADPMQVSLAIDNAYVKYGLSHGNAFVRKYFKALAEFNNLLIIIRGGSEGFMPAGEFTEAELLNFAGAFKKDPAKLTEMIADVFTESKLRKEIRAAYEAYLASGSPSAFEGARDEYLIRLASEGRQDIDSPAPIVGYMLAREREAAVVRLILTAKRSGISMDFIKERGVGLYG